MAFRLGCTLGRLLAEELCVVVDGRELVFNELLLEREVVGRFKFASLERFPLFLVLPAMEGR